MNPLIALLVGALISHAIVRKNGGNELGWWRPAAGAAGAFIPYLQAFFALFGSGAYWQMYMGPTWSLLMVPPLGSAMAMVLAKVSKKPFAQLALPVGLGMVGSIFLALLTEQGAFPLAILLNLRIALAILPGFDVVLLALGLLTLASLLVFNGFQRDISRLGLLCMGAYLLVPAWHAFEARRFGHAYAAALDLQDADIHVLPQPLSMQNWRIIVEDGGGRIHDTMVNLRRKEVVKLGAEDTRTRRIDALYRPKNQAVWRIYRRFGPAEASELDARRVSRAWDAWKYTPYAWLGRYAVFEEFVAVPASGRPLLCVQFMDLTRDGSRREEKGKFVICPGESGHARVFRTREDGSYREWMPLLGV
jgi:hypothetical protein